MTLYEYFVANERRPIHKWTGYFPIYERYFSRFRGNPITLIEIGCGQGGSLQMWKHYFGPQAKIVGVDIRPECIEFEEKQIFVRIGDQGNAEFLESVILEFGNPTIVVDDGSHLMHHMRVSFFALYPSISSDGIYMIEDMQTCYISRYGGGLRSPNSFMEICKNLVDELNAFRSSGAVAPTEFSRTTASIHFHEAIVVFEKGVHQISRSVLTPQPKAT